MMKNLDHKKDEAMMNKNMLQLVGGTVPSANLYVYK